MTAQSMLALILKRVQETKEIVDVSELADQGYSPLEIAEYMREVAFAQVRLDIIPATIIETVEATGAPLEYVAGLMKDYLEGKNGTESER